MLRVLGRRGLEAGISLFAILGFCYVPLGTHTGLEHAKAIFATGPAKRAGAELIQALFRVRAKLTGEVEHLASGAGTPTLPELRAPERPASARPDHSRRDQ